MQNQNKTIGNLHVKGTQLLLTLNIIPFVFLVQIPFVKIFAANIFFIFHQLHFHSNKVTYILLKIDVLILLQILLENSLRLSYLNFGLVLHNYIFVLHLNK